MAEIELSFHGAAGTVTGSKHLLQVGDTRILLDAGLFQGLKKLRQRNWTPPAFDPKAIDHVLLSHTHIDHVGYLPRLVKLGLDAPVHCTPAAYVLAELMLLDSAKIQEEDARRANRKGYSRHKPALPLYSTDDAKRALTLRSEQRFNRWLHLAEYGRVRAMFRNAGHLLGAAFLELRLHGGGREVRVVFSGDIGRFDVPLHLDPRPLVDCDVLIMESTYGDRDHIRTAIRDQIAEPFTETLRGGGTVLIPAFAVGRSQLVTLVLRRLMAEGAIPDVPIHIDSPMAINATRIYSRFLNKRNVRETVFEDGRLRLFPDDVHFHRSVQDSKRLNAMKGPRIVVSSSGMLTGGRVLHHLARLGPDPKNLLVFAGYQAVGTRARQLLDGAREVRIHGETVPIRARRLSMHGLSGHADRGELLKWVESAPSPPSLVYLVHGEPGPQRALASLLRERFPAMTVKHPELDQRFDLLADLARAEGNGGENA